MKTIKLLLVSLLAMLGLAAEAQQVVVYKKDKTVETFKPEEADSVVYAVTTAQAKKVQVMKNGKVVKESAASDVDSVVVKQEYYWYIGDGDLIGTWDDDNIQFTNIDTNAILANGGVKSAICPWKTGDSWRANGSLNCTLLFPYEYKSKIKTFANESRTAPVGINAFSNYIIDGVTYIASYANISPSTVIYLEVNIQ
ncbi:MAG: hypothetical protein MJZ54_05730 [Bacteroidaceae bacterium]|nr:hypothetical protein [Bacteroidaceae bacterium]